MNTNKKQQSSVLFGEELHRACPNITENNASCYLQGVDSSGQAVTFPMSVDLLSKHILLLGGIGTGKTNTFNQMIAQLNQTITSDDIVIIFDAKGDFYREFYRPGDVVISNDSTAIGKGVLDYWNIFNEIDRGERLTESVVEISKALFAEACEKTNQIFFPNAAKDIFMACLLHFIRHYSLEQQTNENLVYYINASSSADIRAMLESYDDLRAMSSYISNDESPQTQGVLSELQQVVREIFLGNFAKTGTLSLKHLVNAKGGIRVFIEYDLSIGKMLSPVYSLMFDMAIKAALSRNRSAGNVYFITDEFKLLPHLNHIDDAVNFGRSLGIKFMVGVQNVEQIYDNYGEDRARSIMSGFSTNICFRVNDAKSREYIQGLFGKNQKIETYMPTIQNKGMIEAQREANVVEDWDITRLNIGEAIVGLPGYEPFVFQFERYKEK
ncbi:MAG: type IV secretion system DNA-binding domain-containing protein [Clostridia bacterium]|nr:type IV secretion system DNA-binding domain-containing protein [Clostridia bacterium]